MPFQFHDQISPITLKIKDPSKERTYQAHVAGSLLWFRLANLLGLIIYFSFCIVDYYLFNSLLIDFLKIRVLVVTPIIILAFFLSFFKKHNIYYQFINVFTVTIGGIGIILMAIVGQHHPEISRNFSGLVPFFLYIYAFLRIRYISASIVGTGLLVGYAIVEWYVLKTPFNIFIANVFYMSASNIAGICVSYLLEYQGKKEYLLQERFAELSLKDALTGLNNRFYFNNVCLKDIQDFIDQANMDPALEKRATDSIFSNYGLIILDIDHFKKVNDGYGHNAGDIVLSEFANILRDNVRKTDDVLRWGGEEFLIVLKSAQKGYIYNFVKKIGKSIQEHDFRIENNKRLHIKCSIGFICIPTLESQSVDMLIDYADQAMYQAKKNGRNKGYEARLVNQQIEFEEVTWNNEEQK